LSVRKLSIVILSETKNLPETTGAKRFFVVPPVAGLLRMTTERGGSVGQNPEKGRYGDTEKDLISSDIFVLITTNLSPRHLFAVSPLQWHSLATERDLWTNTLID
jgi:hypothetical protein